MEQLSTGVPGAPQARAGFRGCRVEKARADDFAEYVLEAYACSTGIQPNVYTVLASEGAGCDGAVLFEVYE